MRKIWIAIFNASQNIKQGITYLRTHKIHFVLWLRLVPTVARSVRNATIDHSWLIVGFFAAFVEDNVTISSIPYFENHARYFVQN